MPRLIDANARISDIKKAYCTGCENYNGIRCRACWVDDAIGLIDDATTVDAVSRGVLDQVRWERDVAIKQLEEHGIPFGGIAPDVVKVVRCKDCKHRGEEGECPMYFVTEIEWDDDGYTECDYVPYDRTADDGFCDRGERREA